VLTCGCCACPLRPGLLNREAGDGVMQQAQDRFELGLRVSTLAKAMIRDAETKMIGGGKVLIIESNSKITQTSKL